MNCIMKVYGPIQMVNLQNNIWSILTDRLMFSRQDDELVKNKAKSIHDNNQLKIQMQRKVTLCLQF